MYIKNGKEYTNKEVEEEYKKGNYKVDLPIWTEIEGYKQIPEFIGEREEQLHYANRLELTLGITVLLFGTVIFWKILVFILNLLYTGLKLLF